MLNAGSQAVMFGGIEEEGLPAQGLDDVGGRGLPLVSALSAAWGVQLADDGKVVWAELDVPSES